METSPSAPSLARLAGVLFAQVRAIGQLGLDANLDQKTFEADSLQRVSFVASLFQALEQVAGLRFSPGETTLLYNTATWPEGSPLAGYAGEDGDVPPSQVVQSLVASWYFQWNCRESNSSPASRPLRAAVWLCKKRDLKSALRYLFDIQAGGWTLESGGVFGAALELIAAYESVSSEEEIPGLFFDGDAPEEWHDWIKAEMVEPEVANDGSFKKKEIFLYLFEECLRRLEEVRNVRTYDQWLLAQWTTEPYLNVYQGLIKRYGAARDVSLKSSLDQFEEIRADSGGLRRVFLGGLVSAPLKAAFRLYTQVLASSYERTSDPDWKERLVDERAMIPRAIAGALLADDPPPLSAAWASVSSALAPVFSAVVLGQDSLRAWRSRPIPMERVLASDEAAEAFESTGIAEPALRKALAEIASSQDVGAGGSLSWSLDQRRLELEIAKVRGEDVAPEALEPHDEIEASIGTIRAWLDAHEDEVRDLTAQLAWNLGVSELRERLTRAMARAPEDRLTELESLSELYPWSDFVHLELGIALDEVGQGERALEHIETAIAIHPMDHVRWQSLGVVLRRLGLDREGLIAYGVSEMLQSG